MRVPILVYHRVTDAPLPELQRYAVRPVAFRRQMRLLRLGGWTTIGPDDIVAARRDGAPLPRRPVMLTFDDAYAELEESAVPVLRANRQTATIYACMDLLGAPSDRLHRDDRDEGATLMDGAALRRVRGVGMSVGSHGRTHVRLTGLDDDRLAEELAGSRALLAEALDEDVLHLAYPYGDHDPRVAAAAQRAGYLTAVTTDSGVADEQSLMALPRNYVFWGEGGVRIGVRLLRMCRAG